MTSMTVSSGTCAYCGHHGEVVPASTQPGDGRGQCADGKACVARLDKISAAGALTRAEAAYAHLASFARGDVVDLSGERFFQPGTVVAPQEDAGGLEDAFLFVRGCGTVTAVRVADLLTGTFTITLQNEAARGNVRWFDEARYAAQNG